MRKGSPRRHGRFGMARRRLAKLFDKPAGGAMATCREGATLEFRECGGSGGFVFGDGREYDVCWERIAQGRAIPLN